METDVFDLRRMFLGDLPWSFLFEVVFRTAFLYTFTFLLIRLMTRRAIGDLSFVELLLIVALGSAVGDPMFYPDVPLLHGMAVISTVVLLNQAFAALVTRSGRLETLLEGKTARVLLEGRLDPDAMRSTGLAQQELFEQLRAHEITHLGQVRAAYLEQNGTLSVFRYAPARERPGLPIEPPSDITPYQQYGEGDSAPATAYYGCAICGDVRQFEASSAFPRCAHDHISWVAAVSGPETQSRE